MRVHDVLAFPRILDRLYPQSTKQDGEVLSMALEKLTVM